MQSLGVRLVAATTSEAIVSSCQILSSCKPSVKPQASQSVPVIIVKMKAAEIMKTQHFVVADCYCTRVVTLQAQHIKKNVTIRRVDCLTLPARLPTLIAVIWTFIAFCVHVWVWVGCSDLLRCVAGFFIE